MLFQLAAAAASGWGTVRNEQRVVVQARAVQVTHTGSKSHIHTHALAYIQRSAQGTHGHTRRLFTTHSVSHALLLVAESRARLETDSALVKQSEAVAA